MDRTALSWGRRATPLPAAAVAARSDDVPRLLAALTGRISSADADLRLMVGAAGGVVLGPESQLPWFDGAHYLGWEAGVLVATHRIPHPPIDLLVPSLRAVLPDSCDLIAVLPWGVLAARMPARPVDLAGVERLTQQWHRKAEP